MCDRRKGTARHIRTDRLVIEQRLELGGIATPGGRDKVFDSRVRFQSCNGRSFPYPYC